MTGLGRTPARGQPTFAGALFDRLISAKQHAISPRSTAHNGAYFASQAAIGKKKADRKQLIAG
jgi:hypothetical protein